VDGGGSGSGRKGRDLRRRSSRRAGSQRSGSRPTAQASRSGSSSTTPDSGSRLWKNTRTSGAPESRPVPDRVRPPERTNHFPSGRMGPCNRSCSADPVSSHCSSGAGSGATLRTGTGRSGELSAELMTGTSWTGRAKVGEPVDPLGHVHYSFSPLPFPRPQPARVHLPSPVLPSPVHRRDRRKSAPWNRWPSDCGKPGDTWFPGPGIPGEPQGDGHPLHPCLALGPGTPGDG